MNNVLKIYTRENGYMKLLFPKQEFPRICEGLT